MSDIKRNFLVERVETKRALVIGVTGQDGAYLCRHLLRYGYEVTGTSRDARPSSFSGLKALGIEGSVRVLSMAPTDFRSVVQTLSKVEPHEIYNLSGQSSVAMSFEQPIETLESVVTGTSNLLEAIRFLDKSVRFYNACSGECFGDTSGTPANEQTPFSPRSPYAVAKAAAFWFVANYRDSYGLHASSGLLFNHESPLRPERFVTRKIILTALRIADGSSERLRLGNLSVQRDWGWAPEYVDAMHRMLQLDQPRDFVVATGQTISLQDFVERTFSLLNLDWREHVETDAEFVRPSDFAIGKADPSLARDVLGWEATTKVENVIKKLISHERHPGF